MSITDKVVGNATVAVADKALSASNLLPHLLDLLGKPEMGGLPGLMQKFEKAGLGHQIKSWVGTDKPLPVTPAELTRALGDSNISSLAAKAGITNDQAARQLATLIPEAVKQLGPDAKLPGIGAVNDPAASITEKFAQ